MLGVRYYFVLMFVIRSVIFMRFRVGMLTSLARLATRISFSILENEFLKFREPRAFKNNICHFMLVVIVVIGNTPAGIA